MGTEQKVAVITGASRSQRSVDRTMRCPIGLNGSVDSQPSPGCPIVIVSRPENLLFLAQRRRTRFIAVPP
jgi:hypothetical protein